MSPSSENPLIKALPPNTDYMTYLTVLEYNLDKSELSLLHVLLQDERLTTNIGWDLVKMLLPLLPESKECLQDVARLGNPREVILKVTEILEDIGTESQQSNENEDDDNDDDQSGLVDRMNNNSDENNLETCESIRLTQFQILVYMLCSLHPRIRTKRPSRFLAASVKAIIAAYRSLAPSLGATRAALTFLRTLVGFTKLASESGPDDLLLTTVHAQHIAPDPEAQLELHDCAEKQLNIQHLRALVTHIMQIFLETSPAVGQTSGQAWTERYIEATHPEYVVKYRHSYTELFGMTDELASRDLLITQIVEIASISLQMDWNSLLSLTLASSQETTSSIMMSDECCCSGRGAFYIMAAKAAGNILTPNKNACALSTSRSHDLIVTEFTDNAAIDLSSVESIALVDAVLILGWSEFVSEGILLETEVDTDVDERFNKYLHRLSVISATSVSSSIRYQAHLFISAVLHAHPSSKARLYFIHDTIENCPYDNIKTSAVGWAKEEFLLTTGVHQGYVGLNVLRTYEAFTFANNIFTSSTALVRLASGLFAPPPGDLLPENILPKIPFYLATLNLLYLLCTSITLRSRLEVVKIVHELDFEGVFLKSMDRLTGKIRELEYLTGDPNYGLSMGLLLLDESVTIAKEAVSRLKQE